MVRAFIATTTVLTDIIKTLIALITNKFNSFTVLEIIIIKTIIDTTHYIGVTLLCVSFVFLILLQQQLSHFLQHLEVSYFYNQR
jgi:hypothetical protein